MNSVRLGSEGPRIGRVGLGTWEISGPSRFGWGPVDHSESLRTIRHAVESGVNWVDTAAFYGRGHSEEVVGEALSVFDVGVDVLVFTKCGLRWDPGTDRDTPPTNDLRPSSIRFECEQSLRRLGVERIDLYQFHWPDELGTPVEESWGAMCELVDEGKVRWTGVSNFDVDLVSRCNAVRHVDSMQTPLNILDRRAREGLTEWCRANGTGVIAYSPMASGLLTGTFSKEVAAALTTTDWRRFAPQFQEPELSKSLDLVEHVRGIASDLRVTVPELVIGWVLSVPGVSAAIAGAKHPEEVDGWIAAPEVELGPEQLGAIEAFIASTGVGIGSYSSDDAPAAAPEIQNEPVRPVSLS